MSEVPREFLARITSHNRNCWLAALMSLLAALALWILLGTFFTGFALLMDTVIRGESALATFDFFELPERSADAIRRFTLAFLPGWLPPTAAALAGGLIIWGLVDRWFRRFRPVTDRPIIGWHLFGEFLLLPARMLFAAWDHISARVRLGRHERTEAWRLLQVILEQGRTPRSSLALEVVDARLLERLLDALQVTGWIDLHRGDDDWFYLVRGDCESELRALILE